MKSHASFLLFLVTFPVLLMACTQADEEEEFYYLFNNEQFPSRYLYIGQAEGYSLDAFPVEVVDTANWDASTLERLPAPVSSAGIEDAPFIAPDGLTLYFTFIGDEDATVGEQLDDPSLGIYITKYSGSSWSEPEKMGLVPNGVKALCGGGSIKRDGTFWFNMFSEATGWKVHTYMAYNYYGNLTIGYNPGAPVTVPGISAGEPDICSNGIKLYINSPDLGGFGGDDLFVFEKIGYYWVGPTNLGSDLNTAGNEIQPFITPDYQSLYFCSAEGASGTGVSIFRSDWSGTEWGSRTEILRNNVGEPSLTEDGQWLYFVHFYFDAGINRLEADIFRIHRK